MEKIKVLVWAAVLATLALSGAFWYGVFMLIDWLLRVPANMM